ncbi:MAG: hypothetical protein ABW199_13095 [Caulobacterales bacterium]
MNSHARFAAHSAKALGYAFRSLDGDDAYLFEVTDGARKAAFPVGYATPYALNNARAYSLARDKSFAQRVLDQAGLATIPSQLFFTNDRQAAYRAPGRERADALAWAKNAPFPVFCKPNQGSKGEYAEIVASADALTRYLDRVSAHYDVILVQPVLRGDEYRVIVLNGAPLLSYKKAQPVLSGDGRSSLRELLEAARVNWKGAALQTPLEDLRARDVTGAAVSLGDVVATAAKVTLEGRANRAAGGDAEAIFTEIPKPLAKIAVEAAKALGLNFAGVDLFDLSPNRDGSNLVVIEVNANPALETLEAQGRFDLIEKIWAANFEAAFA